MPKLYRHAYLHSNEAADENHVFAAALELRAHKSSSTAKYRPGHLFVDNNVAKQVTSEILRDKSIRLAEQIHAHHGYLQQVQQRKTLYNENSMQRRYLDEKHQDTQMRLDPLNEQATSVFHARDNLISATESKRLTHFGTAPNPPDKLYVKGHGNPKNESSISTKVSGLSGDRPQTGSEFQQSLSEAPNNKYGRLRKSADHAIYGETTCADATRERRAAHRIRMEEHSRKSHHREREASHSHDTLRMHSEHPRFMSDLVAAALV